MTVRAPCNAQGVQHCVFHVTCLNCSRPCVYLGWGSNSALLWGQSGMLVPTLVVTQPMLFLVLVWPRKGTVAGNAHTQCTQPIPR